MVCSLSYTPNQRCRMLTDDSSEDDDSSDDDDDDSDDDSSSDDDDSDSSDGGGNTRRKQGRRPKRRGSASSVDADTLAARKRLGLLPRKKQACKFVTTAMWLLCECVCWSCNHW